jgi:hypothetical protein
MRFHETSILNTEFVKQIISIVTSDPIPEFIAPTIAKQCICADEAFAMEERLRTHPDEVDENAVGEVGIFVRISKHVRIKFWI